MSWAEVVKRGIKKEESDKPMEVLTTKVEKPVKVLPHPYLIDIGSNLTSSKFKHCLEDVIKRARVAHVKKQIITGGNLAESINAQKLAHHYPGEFYSTAGIHPHHAKEFNSETVEELEKLLQHPEVVAVGETGLDYFRNLSKPEMQKQSFKAHIELAIKHNMPLFLHERDAHEDFMEVFKEVLYKKQLKWEDLPPVVVHCFTGKAKHLDKYISIGFYVGITGYIAINGRGEHLHRCLPDKVPLDRLMIETDAPYMRPSQAPRLASGQNEPCNLGYVAETLAKIYHVDRNVIWKATTQNAEKFFGITK